MNVEHLLEQYFEGRTTAEDEAALRRFFTSGDVPANLMLYKPLFVYFDSEISRTKTKQAKFALSTGRDKTLIRWLCGVAASVAILTGSFYFFAQPKKCPTTGDYVIIDGRCYTDAATIRYVTLKTLREVSTDGDFFPDNKPSNVMDMIGNQLKEFDFLFDN